MDTSARERTGADMETGAGREGGGGGRGRWRKEERRKWEAEQILAVKLIENHLF